MFFFSFSSGKRLPPAPPLDEGSSPTSSSSSSSHSADSKPRKSPMASGKNKKKGSSSSRGVTAASSGNSGSKRHPSIQSSTSTDRSQPRSMTYYEVPSGLRVERPHGPPPVPVLPPPLFDDTAEIIVTPVAAEDQPGSRRPVYSSTASAGNRPSSRLV